MFLTSLACLLLFLQYRDGKKSARKIISSNEGSKNWLSKYLSEIILTLGLLFIIWGALQSWKDKNDAQIESDKKATLETNRFDSLSVVNFRMNSKLTSVSTELGIRNNEVKELKHKMDSLTINVAVNTTLQLEAIANSKEQTRQVSRSVEEIKNLGFKTVSRSISEDDKKLLILYLKGFVGEKRIVIEYFAIDKEALKFSQQFAQIFQESGWEVFGPVAQFSPSHGSGLWIEVKDLNNIPNAALRFVAMLNLVKIPWQGTANDRLEPNLVRLYVGEK